MNKSRIMLLLFLVTASYMQAQDNKKPKNPGEPVLVEKMTKPPVSEDYTIPYSKYKFSNGLTLIVTEDHSDPIVHVDITYHVGSAREELGKSGFAHFFEHMMFEGSKNVPKGEHFKIVTQAGGNMNGNTTTDRTKYFETLPKNYLETALWLEADRMGFLLESVTQEKFENQRATVKNEKGQSYDNRPYGRLSETIDRNLYPFGHPYSWPTIGYVPDLNRVSVDDLKKFFLRWYGPNNAVLTVGGDVNAEDVVKLVQKYFGSIPAGPEVKRATPEYYALTSDRYVSFEDNVRFPLLTMVYPSVPNFHEDEAALDILAEIMGGGKSSILYQNFVKTQKALQASAINPCSELAGEFRFSILAKPDTKLADMEAMVRASFEDFLKRGVTDDDLEKIKAQKTADAIYSLESVSYKAQQLADYETLLGNPNYIKADVGRYMAVTKKDIMRVFQIYIKDAHCLVVSIYPKGKKELAAAADNYKYGGDSSRVKHNSYDTLKMRTVVDNFSRSKQPKQGPSPIINTPQHTIFDEPIGIKTISIYNGEVPDLYMVFNIKAGLNKQPAGKEGIAYMCTKMMQEASMRMTAEQLNDALDKLGSRVYFNVTQESITVSVQCLTKNYDATIGLVNEMVTHPKLDPEDFKRVKNETMQLIANQAVRADALANLSYNQLLYGKNHPYGQSMYGTKESLEHLTVEDVMQYMRDNITQKNTELSMAGDVKPEDLRRMLMPMGAWNPMPSNQKDVPPATPPAIDKTKIYLVNKDNAPQSEIRIGYVALPYDATGEFFLANLMNYPLGGSFNSRLNTVIREEKGYTYGIFSGFSGNHTTGRYIVSSAVRGDMTDSALIDILDIMKKYAEKGPDKKEIAFTQSSYLESEALKYESNAQKAAFAQRILEYKLQDDFTQVQEKLLKDLKKKEMDQLAKKYLPMDKMVIVVVGDAAKLKDKLSKLGYEVVDFTPDGLK
jgi:zinc protease